MSGEIIGVVAAVVTGLQLCKRVLLGGADAFDEFAHRRPLKRYRELIEAAGPESPLRPALELERDSELFRQIFGKPAARNIEQAILGLRASGEFSTRELRHLLRFAPYDARQVASVEARELAVWNQRVAIVQAVLVGVVLGLSAWGAVTTSWTTVVRLFVPVFGFALLGLFYFVREAIHAHLACQAIDRVRQVHVAHRTVAQVQAPTGAAAPIG